MSVSSEAHSRSSVAVGESFFHVRPVTAQDGPEIHDIKSVRARLLSTGTKPTSLSDVKAAISKADRNSATNVETLFMVAQANATADNASIRDAVQSSSKSQHKLFGYAIIAPHKYSQNREFCERTASLSLDLPEGSALDTRNRQAVQRALVRDMLTACTQRNLRYRTAVLELVYHDDYIRLREDLDLFQREGFRVVGRVERVTEIDGRLFDLFILQKDL